MCKHGRSLLGALTAVFDNAPFSAAWGTGGALPTPVKELNLIPSTTPIIIRPERVADYAEIAALHARAFGNRTGEPLVIALHRQHRVFDPDLSLVAEIDGQLVGHVLFSPHQLRLLDAPVPAVNLAQIAVQPAHRGRCIGGQLITEGHAIAASKGYRISFLLGRTTYYLRFGYHTHAYGSSHLLLPIEEPSPELLEVRGPTDEDVPALCELWLRERAKRFQAGTVYTSQETTQAGAMGKRSRAQTRP